MTPLDLESSLAPDLGRSSLVPYFTRRLEFGVTARAQLAPSALWGWSSACRSCSGHRGAAHDLDAVAAGREHDRAPGVALHLHPSWVLAADLGVVRFLRECRFNSWADVSLY
jgi:hypothetical protein